MAHDAASLLLHRTLNKLVTGMEKRTRRVSRAAAMDFNSFSSDKDVAPSTLREIVGVAELLDEVSSELSQVQEYWHTLPWSKAIPFEDPRAAITPEEEQEVMKAVDDQVAFQQGCVCGRALAEVEAQQRIDEARQQFARGALGGAVAAGTLGALAGAGIGAVVRPPAPAQSAVSPPGPDFDPALLADKRVVVIDVKNDVRTRTTLGDPNAEPVVGGPPAFWLRSADGTRVVILQEDLPKVINALNQLAGNGAQG